MIQNKIIRIKNRRIIERKETKGKLKQDNGKKE